MAAAVFVNGHYAGVTKVCLPISCPFNVWAAPLSMLWHSTNYQSKWVRISRILVNRKWAPLCSLEAENHYNVTVRLLSSDHGLLFNGDKDNTILVRAPEEVFSSIAHQASLGM
jgi:hypothetical protein